MAQTEIIAYVADCHVNSSVALCPPVTNMDDGGTYHASKAQRWIWDCWLDYWSFVAGLAKERGASVTLIIGGDVAEGDAKRRSHQVITRNNTTIERMLEETFRPALDASGRVFVLRGTAAHGGKSAALEEAFANDIGAVTCKETGAASWWRMRHVISGVRLDCAHHGGVGKQPGTELGALGRLWVRILAEYAGYHEPLPHIVTRSHMHRHADTFDNYPTRIIQTPAWQLKTEYAEMVAAESLADIGGLVYVCDNGRYEIFKRIYRMKTKWQR